MLYKDFVAQASITFANNMLSKYVDEAVLNDCVFFKHRRTPDLITTSSIKMAEKLAKALERKWKSKKDSTAFFDPVDQTESISTESMPCLNEIISEKNK